MALVYLVDTFTSEIKDVVRHDPDVPLNLNGCFSVHVPSWLPVKDPTDLADLLGKKEAALKEYFGYDKIVFDPLMDTSNFTLSGAGRFGKGRFTLAPLSMGTTWGHETTQEFTLSYAPSQALVYCETVRERVEFDGRMFKHYEEPGFTPVDESAELGHVEITDTSWMYPFQGTSHRGQSFAIPVDKRGDKVRVNFVNGSGSPLTIKTWAFLY